LNVRSPVLNLPRDIVFGVVLGVVLGVVHGETKKTYVRFFLKKREGLAREEVLMNELSQSWGRSVCPPPHRPQREIPAMILNSRV